MKCRLVQAPLASRIDELEKDIPRALRTMETMSERLLAMETSFNRDQKERRDMSGRESVDYATVKIINQLISDVNKLLERLSPRIIPLEESTTARPPPVSKQQLVHRYPQLLM